MLATRLGLPFVSRLVPADVAGAAGGEALDPDEQPESMFRRVLDALASMPALIGSTAPLPAEGLEDEQRLRALAEAEASRAATTTGGVILGRGAVALLRDDPMVVRVRLDGPVERRIRQAMEIEGVDEATARSRQAATDRVRTLYVQRAYGVDPGDPSLYHVVLDSTALPAESSAKLLADLALGCWQGAAAPR
jgi:hypothetical protein